jgi:hypothetical protein
MDGQIQFEKGSSRRGLTTLKSEGQQSDCVISGPIRVQMDQPDFRRPTR